jgi:hypothetical protein
MLQVRKGQAPETIDRGEFHTRFMQAFQDPDFDGEMQALSRLEQIAWQAYRKARKAPITRKAGPSYADPEYELSARMLDVQL